jgi:hypothetical protein
MPRRSLHAAALLLLPIVLGTPRGAGALAVAERILSGLPEPLFVAAPDGDPRLFVVLRDGRIRIYRSGSGLDPQPFLDIRSEVDEAGEGGLLGLAFDPNFDQTRAFYVYYTTTGPSQNVPLRSRVSRFLADSNEPDLADPAEHLLLTLDQPFTNHNGGTLAFGDDGYLYVGFGDGGDSNDPLEAGQDPGTLLGKMLRIDVSFSDPNDPYAIPPDNPFVGPDGVRDEIWALGLRNPFRFSFDRQGGALYVGDVGQGSVEEVDVEPPANGPFDGGRNYGWDVMEGSDCFFEAPDPGEPNCNDPGLTLPVHEYGHGVGRCSITGGVVYRGSDADLQGHYLFADYCTSEIWSLEWDGAGGVSGPVVDRTAQLEPDQGSIDSPVGFGEDGFGEVYLVDKGSGSDGEVFALVPEPAGALLLAAGAAVLLGAARTLRRGA